MKTYLITETTVSTREIRAESKEAAQSWLVGQGGILVDAIDLYTSHEISLALQNDFLAPIRDVDAANEAVRDIGWDNWETDEEDWEDPDEAEHFKVESIVWCRLNEQDAEDIPSNMALAKLLFKATGVTLDNPDDPDEAWSYLDKYLNENLPK